MQGSEGPDGLSQCGRSHLNLTSTCRLFSVSCASSTNFSQTTLSLRFFRLILPLLFGIAFHLQLVLLSYHPIFLRPYRFLTLISSLGANRTKSASVCPYLLRGAI